MGKIDRRQQQQQQQQQRQRDAKYHTCEDATAPICGCPITTTITHHVPRKATSTTLTSTQEETRGQELKEVLVIGAGPHALSLLLRLLAPEADFLTEECRHILAEHAGRQRPIGKVYQYVKRLFQGPNATLKKKRFPDKEGVAASPPTLALEKVLESVHVVDAHGGWLTGWKQNFEAIGITHLRSPINAHADPFDHRSMQAYAERNGREDELVTLPYLSRSKDFRGPYQAPSTQLFHDFHDLLTRAYGIHNMVTPGTVQAIIPKQASIDSDESIFEVKVATREGPQTLQAKRVVCAMGPIFRTGEAFWEASLHQKLGSSGNLSVLEGRLLHAHEIVPWLKKKQKENKEQTRYDKEANQERPSRLLIVGGGITSAQLALLASSPEKSPWCQSVTLIQRSKTRTRQFDLEDKWMGPRRGKLLAEFWSRDSFGRAKLLKEARQGGSIPPEIVQALSHREKEGHARLLVKEEVQIMDVDWRNGQFQVELDDACPSEEYDMIWLATGGDNDIDSYPALRQLREILPIQVVNGLPVLNQDLSWRCPSRESDQFGKEAKWKEIARENLWVMGALSALELGPDALNVVGARHGAVRVARAIRSSMANIGTEVLSL